MWIRQTIAEARVFKSVKICEDRLKVKIAPVCSLTQGSIEIRALFPLFLN